jgi:2-phospho-L-lactate transferase CofD
MTQEGLRHILIVGGGHGPGALSEIARQAKVTKLIPDHDEGGSTGKMKLVWPDIPGLGDVNKNLIISFSQRFNQINWDLLLNRQRATNTETMQKILNEFIFSIQRLTPFCPNVQSFLEEVDSLRELINQYYLLAKSCQAPTHLRDLNLIEQADSLGNLLLAYFYFKFKREEQISRYFQEFFDLNFDFRFPFNERTELWATSKNHQNEEVLLRSEGVIDIYTREVYNLKAWVKNFPNQVPTINHEVKNLLQTADTVFLAPGSPENYEVMLVPELVELINRRNIPVIMIAPLFRHAKDRKLTQIISDIANSGLHQLTIWLPEAKSVIEVMSNPETLIDYAKEDKEFQMIHLASYQNFIKRLLTGIMEKGHESIPEEYRRIYSHYIDQMMESEPIVAENVRMEMNQSLKFDPDTGYKHQVDRLVHMILHDQICREGYEALKMQMQTLHPALA